MRTLRIFPPPAASLAACLLVLVAGCAEPSSQAGYLLASGVTMMNSGDYGLADMFLERSLQADSTLVVGWYYRGISFADQMQTAEAESCFAQALRVKPVHYPTLVVRGYMRLHRMNIVGAMSDFSEVCNLYPKLSQGYKGRGLVYEELGCDGEAIDELGFAIGRSPEDPALYQHRGFAFLRTGMADSAMIDFTRALSIDPTLSEAHAGRGESRYLLGFNFLAIADCDTAIQLDDLNAGAWLMRGRAADSAGLDDEAVESYRRFLELVPESDPDVLWVKSQLGRLDR